MVSEVVDGEVFELLVHEHLGVELSGQVLFAV